VATVLWFHFGGLSLPRGNGIGDGVLAFFGPKKTFKDDVLSSNFARWSVT